MKYFYYVGIQVNDGLVFITSLNTKNKQFAYDCVKQPLLFSSQDDAIDIVENLCMNLVQAVVVTSPIEINRHFVSLDAIKEALLEEPKIKELGLSKNDFYIDYEDLDCIYLQMRKIVQLDVTVL